MLKQIKSVCALLLVLFLSQNGYATNAAVNGGVDDVGTAQQSNACTGVVKDATGETIIGASIVVKGTKNATITNIDGQFTLSNVKNGDVIVISYLGYVTQEITYTGKALNIILQDDSKSLDEVVVTALGMKRSAKALGYAMTELKGDDLNANVVNPVSALQGKIAGVDISGSDGGLFGSAKILIRGNSTLGSNNQPIYVVDGVILDNGVKEGDADWSTNDTDWGNELKNLNPDDFESVSVLKGAAATALYGSRGLNGAVVITTKSGKGKKGLGISFTQTVGVDHVYGGPDFQNIRGDGYYAGTTYMKSSGNRYDTNSFYLNSNGVRSVAWAGEDGGAYGYGPKFDGQPIEGYDYQMVPYSAVKNNFVDAYDDGWNSNTNISVQGSNDKTSFYTSLSYKYADGNTPNNKFQRLSLLAKATHKITDAVELEAGVSFANSKPEQGGVTNFGEYFIDGTLSRMYDTRYWRTRYKGSHGGLASNTYNDEYGNTPGKSIWWSLYENSYTQKETSVRPNVKLTADLTSWLKFTAEGNYNYYYKRYEAKELGSGYANEGGYYALSQYTKEQTNFNANLSWNKDVKDWNINGFLRGEYYHNYEQYLSLSTNDGLVVPGKFFINNSKKTINSSGYITGEKTIMSIAGQLAFSWRDQVFFDVTGRNDWSSSLVYADKHGNYSYFYPSVSASWLIHETFRDKLPSWISFAKVRASWAQVGNDTESYLINSAYTLYGIDNTYGLSVPTTSYDQNLKPERKNSWEVGLDWRFLKNRIGIDFTYYKENTKNQIMEISVPSESGLSSQLINAGNIQNQGIEIALNTTPIQTKDWTWDLNFTYTKNKSKIVSLHENVADYITLVGMAAYGNYRIASVAEVGGEYGLLKSDAAPNYDEKTGLPILDLSYYNSNYHAVYYGRSGEVRTVGSTQPDFLGSVNTSLRYKDFTLRASLDARFGGMVAIYGSHYGTCYGFLERSMVGTDSEHGGITYTSIWDGNTYDDGIIPNAIMPGGSTINTPTGTYTIAEDGETYASLVERGIVDPQHASTYTMFQNMWGTAAVWKNNDWFHELNYIALREVSLSYRMPQNIAKKIGANNINLTLTGRNLGYLLNSLPNNFNPESLRGTQSGQFLIRSVSPYTASYTFTINATF